MRCILCGFRINVAMGDIVVRRVDGKTNIADTLTNHVNGEDIGLHLFWTSPVFTPGRHPLAPEVNG